MVPDTLTSLPFASASAVELTFVDYYIARDYHLLPGSRLLDRSIPSAFVMSAGLVQVEHGLRTGRLPGQPVVLVQTCFRQFDLDEAGQSGLHLSLFRMAGAFAFGIPQRAKQIPDAWRILTQVYRLPNDRLWVTCFAGGQVDGVFFPPDEASFRSWLEVDIPAGHLIQHGPQHNFWRQSDRMMTGKKHIRKCGPNSEVFFDRGPQRACGPDCLPGCRCGRFVEVMNILWITAALHPEQSRAWPLKKPFTEIVVGIERLAMLLQGVETVYKIDSIQPLQTLISRFDNASSLGKTEREYAYRLLADRWRALLSLTADGAPEPTKEGQRNYLIQRVIRDLLAAQMLLEIEQADFYSSLFERGLYLYSGINPRIPSARSRILKYIEVEQMRFRKTLQKAEQALERLLEKTHGQVNLDNLVEIEKKFGYHRLLLFRALQQRGIACSQEDYELALERWKAKLPRSS